MASNSSLIPNWSSTNSIQISHESIPSEERAEEPLGLELREELRQELKRFWYSWKEEIFGQELKQSWTSGPKEFMTSIDGSAISTLPIYQSHLLRFCNKPTVLYWAHSAKINNLCPRFIWGCIYKEWFRCYDQAPRLDFQYFFANPVCIESTGPSTIFELLETHKCFYNRTALLLDKIRSGESNQPYMETWPDQFKLLPVCRAIIVVLDKLVLDPDEQGPVYLDLELQRQNVLMVRTGNETGLSKPISFESVRDLALPLARPDIETHSDIDAIRVPLATAVKFIVNLQRREEIAFPESAPSTAVDRGLYPLSDTAEPYQDRTTDVDIWVDRELKLADEKGIDKVWTTRGAMLAVQAARRGEHPDESYPSYFRSSWR